MELHVASGDPSLPARGAPPRAARGLRLRRRRAGGFFETPVDGERLVARKKDFDDHPAPSGNAMLAYVLLRLARLWGDDELEAQGVSVLRLVRDRLLRSPSSFGWLLVAFDQYLAPHREVAIVGERGAPVAQAALAAAAPDGRRRLRPRRGVPLLRGESPSTAPPPSMSASASPAGLR